MRATLTLYSVSHSNLFIVFVDGRVLLCCGWLSERWIEFRTRLWLIFIKLFKNVKQLRSTMFHRATESEREREREKNLLIRTCIQNGYQVYTVEKSREIWFASVKISLNFCSIALPLSYCVRCPFLVYLCVYMPKGQTDAKQIPFIQILFFCHMFSFSGDWSKIFHFNWDYKQILQKPINPPISLASFEITSWELLYFSFSIKI